jgi:hypothetical protein
MAVMLLHQIRQEGKNKKIYILHITRYQPG